MRFAQLESLGCLQGEWNTVRTVIFLSPYMWSYHLNNIPKDSPAIGLSGNPRICISSELLYEACAVVILDQHNSREKKIPLEIQT